MAVQRRAYFDRVTDYNGDLFLDYGRARSGRMMPGAPAPLRSAGPFLGSGAEETIRLQVSPGLFFRLNKRL
jgi:hypothetical protein